MVIVAFSGYACDAAEKAYVSDSSSDDFVDGLVLRFFLKPDTGVPFISINVTPPL